MRCEDARDWLSDHLNGDLGAAESASLDAHLSDCEACRGVLAELRWVKGLLAGVPAEPLPVGFGDRLHAALGALPETAELGSRIPCDEASDYMSGHLSGGLDDWEQRAFTGHVEDCAPCRRMLVQTEATVALLKLVPREPLPGGLPARIHAALAALPAQGAGGASVLRDAPRVRLFSWTSALAGAVAAGFALFFITTQQPTGLPRIETAAVSVKQDVALNIGFDVGQSVEGVTFQIDLPDGLQFIDEKAQPMLAQSVSWKGSLKEGKTVVPIVVRGVRPGRYEIEAFVRKGPMLRKTTIMLPVNAT